MSKGGSIGGGKASRGVCKSKHGGGTITIKKSVARKTTDVNDSIMRLREAVFTPSGQDKDVSKGIAPAFMKFDRNGLNLEIVFTPKLSRAELQWAFNLTKTHMESVYDASGYGWDDNDKMKELSEQGTRFLIAREKTPEGSPPGPVRAFVHFRFTVQGEVMDTMAGAPCLYVWDVQLEEPVQRKGLGKHLLMILELIGKREKMEQLCVPVQLNDDDTVAWIESIRGFGPDTELQGLVGFDAEMEVTLLIRGLK
jgi:N-alpha-acetyltransferase 40